jgi:hypothetical protein
MKLAGPVVFSSASWYSPLCLQLVLQIADVGT